VFPEPGGYPVVWWDPGALTLGAKPPFGVRRDDLIVKDVPRHVVADGRSRYDRWRLARLDARAAGAAPTLAVQTVREWTADEARELPPAARAIDVAIAEAERTGGDTLSDEPPGGAAFGALVHAVLAQASFDATRETLEDVARVEARVLGLRREEAAVAARKVERVFRHPLLVRARAAAMRGVCRRETPVTCPLPDGTIVEGIVDLAFEEAGTWIVVDYKTDREFAAGGEERYRRQVALYAAAIAQATGAAAAGVIMRV
jgi:ATP-dependent exoDNAse (exonuclease V) beta subunit